MVLLSSATLREGFNIYYMDVMHTSTSTQGYTNATSGYFKKLKKLVAEHHLMVAMRVTCNDEGVNIINTVLAWSCISSIRYWQRNPVSTILDGHEYHQYGTGNETQSQLDGREDRQYGTGNETQSQF